MMTHCPFLCAKEDPSRGAGRTFAFLRAQPFPMSHIWAEFGVSFLCSAPRTSESWTHQNPPAPIGSLQPS